MKDLLAQLRTDKDKVIEGAKKEIEQEQMIKNNEGMI